MQINIKIPIGIYWELNIKLLIMQKYYDVKLFKLISKK